LKGGQGSQLTVLARKEGNGFELFQPLDGISAVGFDCLLARKEFENSAAVRRAEGGGILVDLVGRLGEHFEQVTWSEIPNDGIGEALA